MGRTRRFLPPILVGIAVVLVADLHRLDPTGISTLPILAPWPRLMDAPAVALTLHGIAAALVIWGVVRLLLGGDSQLALARSLKNRGDHRGAAEVYFRSGDMKRALKLYEKSHSWVQAAEAAGRLDLTERAASLLRRAGGRNLADAARLYRQMGDSETAVRCERDFAAWLMDDGHFDEAVEVWLRAGDAQRAVRAANLALKRRRLQPTNPAFRAARRAANEVRDHHTLALLAQAEGDWLGAAQSWRRAGEHGFAAENFRKIGQLTEAANAEAAAGRPREAAQLRVQRLQRAQDRLRVMEKRGDHATTAAVTLREQVRVETDALVPVLGRLQMRDEMIEILSDSGRVEEAVNRLVSEDQMTAAAELARNAQRWDLAAGLLENLERWGEASDVYELAGDIESAAKCAEQAGEDERALQLYRSLNRPDKSSRCLARLGFLQDALIELHRADLLSDACEVLRSHPGPVPDIPDVILDMAEWAGHHASRADAIAVLQRAVVGVALQTGRLGPAVALARALLDVGDLEAAATQIDRLLTFDYSHGPAQALRADLESARSAWAGAATRGPDSTEVVTAPARAQQRYEILTELGRGGMGVVYKARDTRLERDVAIKVLRTTSSDEAARLEQEAKAAATLNHPGIVTVYDFEAGFDGYFIAMEFVPGEGLDQLLRQDPGRVRSHLRELLIRLADAVAFAHRRRVIHRDLKPGNILVTADMEVKILDFGIAARLDSATSAAAAGVCGTPFYMAPEQIRGEVPTPATDIYAFGATAFHLATGRPPFARGNVIDAHLTEAPQDPRELAPDLSPDLARIILKCLEKAPEDRFQSADDLGRELQKSTNQVS
jgi:tRNA A-37 threonylcarbamoyl transferase component Bud32